MSTEKQLGEDSRVRVRIKVSVHGKERFFGPGICELLENIDTEGSIQGAAARMNMSYSKAWKILNRAEQEMNDILITRVNGGKNGGSSALTEKGRRTVAAYREMEAKLAMQSEQIFRDYMSVFDPAAGKLAVQETSHFVIQETPHQTE